MSISAELLRYTHLILELSGNRIVSSEFINIISSLYFVIFTDFFEVHLRQSRGRTGMFKTQDEGSQ